MLCKSVSAPLYEGWLRHVSGEPCAEGFGKLSGCKLGLACFP